MSKDTTKNASMTQPTKDFDFSAYLPQGYAADELKKIGGLTPIYAPEAVEEHKFPPCVGFLVGTETLPAVVQGKETFIPKMIRIHLTADTKGVVGKAGDGREIVDLKKGDDILVPVNGNLEANKVLLAAADHPDNVYLAAFLLKGSRKVNNMPSPMWDWDVRLHPKHIERKGTRYDLPAAGAKAVAQLEGGRTSTGEVYDKDGVVKERVVASA